MKTKVFCIGFHKTGTSSLDEALILLGYRVAGATGLDDPNIGENVYAIADSIVPDYDAFQDNPWPIIYRYLDQSWPGSKFILTTRDTQAWLGSALKHFGRLETPMRRWIYGHASPEGHEAVYVERFERHNREVLEYFSERPGDLLVMDLSRGDGWDELCQFLDVEAPGRPFPHANKASEREVHGPAQSSPEAGRTLKLLARGKSLARRLAGRGQD